MNTTSYSCRWQLTAALAFGLFPVGSALAFNPYGHMSVAYVAYQKLTPTVRDKANTLLEKNPDYTNWVAMIPTGTSASKKKLMLFMIASTWSDRIKSAHGYHEDNAVDRNKCGPPSTQNIGFTDTFRHRCWHFVDTAFSQDNTPLIGTPVPNAQERITLFRPVLGSNDDDLKAYDLSWLLHLVGDLHQPLHCTTRVRQGQTDGDAGGNLTFVIPKTSQQALHQYWDDILGTSTNLTTIISSAKKLPAADPTKAADLDVGHWVDEGVQLAKTAVYIAPVGPGGGPFTLTLKYKNNAKALGKRQVALAGERLANLLNAELK